MKIGDRVKLTGHFPEPMEETVVDLTARIGQIAVVRQIDADPDEPEAYRLLVRFADGAEEWVHFNECEPA